VMHDVDAHAYDEVRYEEYLERIRAFDDDSARASTSLQRHHRKRRSQGGTDAPENIMLVTLEQHDWIHRNVARSYELGWLVHSWDEPSQVPITAIWTSEGPKESGASLSPASADFADGSHGDAPEKSEEAA